MSQRLPAVKPKAVIHALQRGVFFIHHTSGSHHILKHPSKPDLRVTVPFHNKDLKRKTLASIVDQAGYTPEEFITLP
jgi:predicted RNA binding protein YcfA (HicA-like mRNA interferase family)